MTNDGLAQGRTIIDAMRRVITVMLLVLATLHAAAVRGQEPPASRDPRLLLRDTRCAAEALAAMRTWSTDLDAGLADPPGPSGARAVRLPTSDIGRWIRLTADADGALRLERIDASRAETYSFDTDCRLRLEGSVTGTVPAANAFTDGVLEARLRQQDSGVILLWSPHMPLSVDEYAELRWVAGMLGISLIAVLDPAAEVDYARRVAAERGIPPESLRPLRAIELAFRGMTTHAPSVQVFQQGRLVGPVLYGYRDRITAREAIAAVLGTR